MPGMGMCVFGLLNISGRWPNMAKLDGWKDDTNINRLSAAL